MKKHLLTLHRFKKKSEFIFIVRLKKKKKSKFIFQYLAAFECNTTSGWQNRMMLHLNLQNLGEKCEECS